MDIHVNDILKMKKPHPCGSQDWLVPVSYTHLDVYKRQVGEEGPVPGGHDAHPGQHTTLHPIQAGQARGARLEQRPSSRD